MSNSFFGILYSISGRNPMLGMPSMLTNILAVTLRDEI
jgi:hypothetical protein